MYVQRHLVCLSLDLQHWLSRAQYVPYSDAKDVAWTHVDSVRHKPENMSTLKPRNHVYFQIQKTVLLLNPENTFTLKPRNNVHSLIQKTCLLLNPETRQIQQTCLL